MTPDESAEALYSCLIVDAFGWLRPGYYVRDGECLTDITIRHRTTLN